MQKWQKNIPTTKKQSCYICETSTTTKPEVVAQLVNKMRVLTQEIKTVIEAHTKKLSKDPNTRVATSQERQAKPDRKSSEGPHFWGDSCHTKEKQKGIPPLTRRDMVQSRKKIDPTQERELPQERSDLNSRKWRLPFVKLGKYRWTPKWKTRKHIQNALKTKVTYTSQTLQFSGINKNPYEEPIV